MQPVNNGYTRCSECSEVYSSNLRTCPKCGSINQLYSVNEGELNDDNTFITEDMNLVFNIVD